MITFKCFKVALQYTNSLHPNTPLFIPEPQQSLCGKPCKPWRVPCDIWYINMRCHQMPSQDSSVLKRKCHMKLCYMPHTKVVLWYFTWFGCEQPDRQVCLALSVQEPSFRCRGLAGSSPSAHSGWSRTSHRSQIPRSTPWINKDLQTFESQPRYWFSEQGAVVEVRLSQPKLNQIEKGNSYLAYSSNQSATEALSQPPWSCNPQRHIWI